MALSLSPASSWPSRCQSIQQALADPALHTLLDNIAKQSPATAAAITKAYQRTQKGKQKATIGSDTEAADAPADIPLELALSAYWAAASTTPTPRRVRAALASLQSIAKSNLTTTDFPSVTSLQRSSAAYVEIVRARFDRQLYVLKTVVKGTAKREANRCSPVVEATILAKAQSTPSGRRHIPQLLASFQTQNSLHIVMQYFPAGDLDQLLHSAGEAGLGRSVGGLLDETYVKSYATDIVAAVAWCHEQSYAHRDIKPANFLLDRTGHLKLCDFATAAPFSTFDVPADGTRLIPRRRIHHFYSCLAGTPDYIAPDVLLGEEERLNNLATRSRDPWRAYQGIASAFTPDESSASAYGASFGRPPNLKQPDPDSEGFYGPEVDWWSVGVVVYEMVFKNVPFWAETIREAHHRIRNHEQYLQIPNTAGVSRELKSLIRALLSKRQVRLGASLDGSNKVMAHPFFRGTDWENCLDAPAPFIPNVPGAGVTAATHDIIEEEPSILHSPRPAGVPAAIDESDSTMPESLHLSQIYQGNPDDFPAFVDSRDAEEMAQRQQKAQTHQPDPSPVHTSQESSLPRHARAASEPTSPSEPMSQSAEWKDVDLTWLGFTALPAVDAFGPVEPQPQSHQQRTDTLPTMSTPAPAGRTRAASVLLDWSPICISAAPSPEGWEKMPDGGDADPGPIASTPYGRASSAPRSFPTPLPGMSTPFATAPKSLQRQAIAQASRLSSMTPGDGRFVTPMRKTSMPDIASAYNTGIPSISRPAPSPYPFPVAARATPGTADRQRLISMSMRRGVAAPSMSRQVSLSPGYSQTGAASSAESRCSGGSNAKRDMSEQEAMQELTNAVLQSARKVRIDHQEVSIHRRLAALEEQVELTLGGGGGGESSMSQYAESSRPHMSHSRTDSQLLKLRPAKKHSEQRGMKMPRSDSTPSFSSATTKAPTPAKLGPLLDLPGSRRPRSAMADERPRLSATSNLFNRRMMNGNPALQAPVLNLPDPLPTSATTLGLMTPGSESEPDSPLMSRPGTANGYVGRLSRKNSATAPLSQQYGSGQAANSQGQESSSSSLRPPRAPQLRKRRSDRQLKLEAQQKTTPTRLNKAHSPLLTTHFGVNRLSLPPPRPTIEHEDSIGAASGSTSSGRSTAGDSCPSLVEDGSSSDSGSSSGGESDVMKAATLGRHSQLAVPRLSAPPTLGGHSLQKSRSRSYGQLPRLDPTPENGPVKFGLIQEEGQQKQRGSTVAAPPPPQPPRLIRRKDSREMLNEYRLASSPTVSEFPQDAFGPGIIPAVCNASVNSNRRRPASMANLRRSFLASSIDEEEGESVGKGDQASGRHRKYSTEGSGPSRRRLTSTSSNGSEGRGAKDVTERRQRSTSSGDQKLASVKEVKVAAVKEPKVTAVKEPKVTAVPLSKVAPAPVPAPVSKVVQAPAAAPSRALRPTRHSLFNLRSQPSHAGGKTAPATVGQSQSPLGKMDHRLVGLQGSVESLQSRIERIKRSLNGN